MQSSTRTLRFAHAASPPRRALPRRRHGPHGLQRGVRESHRRGSPGLCFCAVPLHRCEPGARPHGPPRAGPEAQRDELGPVARPRADGAARHGRLHGADAGRAQAHSRGRCRDHHRHPAGSGRRPRRGLHGRSSVAHAGACGCSGRRRARPGAGHQCRGRQRHVDRQPAGGRGRAVRGELRHPRQAAGSALPRSPPGARRQRHRAGDGAAACVYRPADIRSARRRAWDVGPRHLVRAVGERPLPVAVVQRTASCRDLAGGPRHRRHAGGRSQTSPSVLPDLPAPRW
jgi:hypothetical protein